jgi:plasmid stabilization system protein ParE
MRYRLAPEARDEFREAALHYLAESPRVAAAFVDEIEAAIGRVCQQPQMWRG